MLGPRPGRILAIVLALLIAAPAYTFGQVWKPRSHQQKAKAKAKSKAKANAKASPAKKTRKATKTSKVKRSKKVAPKKKKAAKKKKRRVRDDDDFSIVEENYPDE